MPNDLEYVFPAIRGIQAQREYYVSMCPMRLLPRLFLFNEAELVPELRVQRHLNKARIPEISRYLTQHSDDYVFSAITASIDAEVKFERHAENGDARRLGLLRIPMSARFIINDGQHRRAAIESALREKPELGDESIAVVFFLDIGLERCQQMFADLNRHAIRPSKSIGILYDHRDETAMLVKAVIANSPTFQDVVELEKISLSPRSSRLFTLSALYNATNELLMGMDNSPKEMAQLAIDFWEAVAGNVQEWGEVRRKEVSAGEVRAKFIHTHGVVLQALARTGRELIRLYPVQWKKKLAAIKDLDWKRDNSKLWEGRVLVGGRVSKSRQNVILATNVIKNHLGLALSSEEHKIEEAFKRGNNG